MSQSKKQLYNIDNIMNPFNTVGLFTFLRTYARRHNEDDPNSTIESWQESIERVVEACNTQLKVGFTNNEKLELFKLLYNLKCSVAGRFLWQLGTKTVEKLGLPSLQNCAAVVINSPVEPFTWSMNMLMLGSGVGFRILPADLESLPEIKYSLNLRKDTKDADFVVPDSREGWVKLLGKVLKSHFYSGKSFTYSCLLLRSKGAPIKSFGGLASGPEVLCDGMVKIDNILNARVGKKLRPIDALDIMNIIGMIVVSGNVRRSALLALGDCKDKEYLNAKRWDLGNIPNYRAFSNNSVVCNDINEILENKDFWEGYNGNGEPYGLINLKLSQTCGRLGETKYPDPDVVCYNPCFSGNTMIATADGRGAVSIKQLAEQGKDVPVYSIDPETSEVSIQWGRNPRITGKDRKMVKIHFDGSHIGEYIVTTTDHKFFTNDGRTVEAKDLKQGDSLPKFKRSDNGIKNDYIVIHCKNQRKTEHRMIKKFFEPEKFNEMYQDDVKNGCCETGNVVVHHKDENKQNNNPDNLEILEFNKHSEHHGKELIGDKNPMYGKKHSETTKKLIGEKTKERNQDPEYKKKFLESFTEESRKKLSEHMQNQKYNWDCERCDEQEDEARKSNLKTVRLSPTCLKVLRKCEHCKEDFLVDWNKRGQPYCSISCGNTKKESIETRRIANRITKDAQSKQNLHNQIMIYKDLQQKLGEYGVLKKVWEDACRSQGVSFRFQTNTPNPYIAKNWGDFQKRARDYNHRVLKVEFLDETETVYNITVENNHTLAVVTKMDNEKINLSGVFTNNCAEQSLNNTETCCLSELYLPNIKTKEELYKCVTYMYRISKHSLSLPCADSKNTENIVHKNMRMGIGVTGYLQATDEQRGWLKDCYLYLRDFDREYSIKNGFPISIKLTTCKPSGTLSLLGGCTSGVHPGFAQYYIRRIRIASESPLIKLAKNHGYPIEYVRNFDGSLDHTTQIISFPYRLPEGTVLAENCTAIEQLEWVKKLQTEWSDNSVSVTVYYRKNELSEIKSWLSKNYNNSVKTVSFLLHNDHGFAQAPLEQITKEQYEELVSQCKPITSIEGICYVNESEELLSQAECANGICPIK